jgi:hypothetical protein
VATGAISQSNVSGSASYSGGNQSINILTIDASPRCGRNNDFMNLELAARKVSFPVLVKMLAQLSGEFRSSML